MKMVLKREDKHPEYYEAIVQIRPLDRKLLDYIYSLIEKRNDVWISKEKRLKTGIDLYLSSQRYARTTLVSSVRKRFKVDVKVTKALYGVDKMTSKKIYRATVLFRLKES